MGRERIAKRMADLAFKMAADNLCSSESVLDHQERPVHVAFFDKKLPCPQMFCKDKGFFFLQRWHQSSVSYSSPKSNKKAYGFIDGPFIPQDTQSKKSEYIESA